jgi:hypothetical protein
VWEGGTGKMKVSRGKIHKYLGMTLDYSVPGQVSITTIPYIEEILDAFEAMEPSSIRPKSSAAPEDLFKIDESCEKLNLTMATSFHNLVAKTLFATKRATPDTCTAVAYLSARVKEPDTDDWRKMVHLMQCFKGYKGSPPILKAGGNGIVKWWVDGSFGVTPT